ncbi:hypothetical protein KJ965_04685 [Patescibacteria group bacterium]|nr:hypothetical protein [Patescibacteria group bacterium]
MEIKNKYTPDPKIKPKRTLSSVAAFSRPLGFLPGSGHANHLIWKGILPILSFKSGYNEFSEGKKFVFELLNEAGFCFIEA